MTEPPKKPASLRPWDLRLRRARFDRKRAMLEQSDAARLVPEWSELEAYEVLKSIDEGERGALMALMSPEQLCTVADLDGWQGAEFSPSDLLVWFAMARETEGGAARLARALDPEVLGALLVRRLHVAVRPEEDAAAHEIPEWLRDLPEDAELRETPDRRFVFSPRTEDAWDALRDVEDEIDEDERKSVVELVEELYREEDLDLAVSALRMAEADLASDLEETALRFKSARLEELGFPSFERAREMLAPLPPSALDGDRAPTPPLSGLPARYAEPTAGTELARALDFAADVQLADRVEAELVLLVNALIVAHRVAFVDDDAIAEVVRSALGRIEIALGATSDPGVMLRTHALRTLYRVGDGAVEALAARARAVRLDTLSPSHREAVEGLRRRPPRTRDGRPLQGLDDLEAARTVLGRAEPLQRLESARGLLAAARELPNTVLPTVEERTIRTALVTGAARVVLGAEFAVQPLILDELERLAATFVRGVPSVSAAVAVALAPEADVAEVEKEIREGLEALAAELAGLPGHQIDARFVSAALVQSP